ncbi:MAG: ferritin family protein [Theionarchaea archaeon]|nr:MAG: hypothetical protein AYK18_04130 [Theionarchaea archaeon DG-70]MBU7011843.1 ferritin family protein [Theionarchaea archaeon]
MEDDAHVLATALELERKGFTFYSEAAKKTENETGKKMFSQLAKEEEEHIGKIKKMFSNLYPQNNHKEIPLFNAEISEYSGEIDAIRIGIDMEKKSIEFYKNRAKGNLKSLFNELIEFEKEHLELLQAELDYVQKTGFWFDYFESSLED